MHILRVRVCGIQTRSTTISEAANDTDGTGGKNARSGGGRGRPGKSSGSGGGGGPGGAKSNHKPARVPKTPKTAEELDRELEAYLVNDHAGTGTAGGAIAPTAMLPVTTVGAAAAEDVEMA